jgi:dGTPase
VRAHGGPLVTFSFRAFEEARALKAFLQKRAYEHPRVIETLQPSYLMLSLIFEVYMDNPRLLPANWFARFQATDTPARAARVVCDYIAGMTDPYALKAYERLKAATGA